MVGYASSGAGITSRNGSRENYKRNFDVFTEVFASETG